MRTCALSLIVSLIVASFVAADDRHTQIEAARLAAQARVSEMILDEPLGGGVTVGEFLHVMGGEASLWRVINQAQQVGGVRWIDRDTCQVRLDVPARDVGALLLDLALAQPNRTPIPYLRLENRVRQWDRRSFSATASSLTWERAEALSPPESARAWQQVDAERRQTAIRAARDDAGRRLARTLLAGSPELTEEAALAQWIAEQPVTAIEFRDDRSVEVAVAVEPEALARRLGADAAGDVPPIVTGVARVDAPGGEATSVVIPSVPPAWAQSLLDATGEAQFAGSPLKTARVAERDAQARLRARVMELAWADGQNLGEASHLDGSIEPAIQQAMTSAKIAAVDYRADGSVSVRLTVPGQNLWRQLASRGPRR